MSSNVSFGHPPKQSRPPSPCPAGSGVHSARSDAIRIAQLVLAEYPTAVYVELEEYLDDDSIDCGHVVAADGSLLIEDATDIAGGGEIEVALENWNGDKLFVPGATWLGRNPVTGMLRIDLRIAAELDSHPDQKP